MNIQTLEGFFISIFMIFIYYFLFFIFFIFIKISNSEISFEDMVTLHLAPKLLNDEVSDENQPYHKIKNTLRHYESYLPFKNFLKQQYNSEALELYHHILKYLRLNKLDESFRISSLKYIFSNYIDSQGKHAVLIFILFLFLFYFILFCLFL